MTAFFISPTGEIINVPVNHITTVINMEIWIVYAPTVFVKEALPGYVSTAEQAVDYASALAKEKGQKVLLCLSRRDRLWFQG